MENFLKFLKQNESLRKIFGKSELKIIEKQLLGINLTQSEKNRLSRDIRKKFEVIKLISDYKEYFELKKASLIKDLIKESMEIILEDVSYKNIKKIVLFGSTVENELTFRSDIDIAVEFFNITIKEATAFRIRISGKVNNKIDIQVYNFLPDKIKNEIKKKGKVLYERKN